MMPNTDPASLPLRDIHLPEAVSWWPPAPGWWLLSVIVIASVLAVIYFLQRRKRYRSSAIYLGRQELERIRRDFETHNNEKQLIVELSALLRRLAISVYGREVAASLTGEEWLQFLDKVTENREFSRGVGRILVDAPYQAAPQFDKTELLSLVTHWMQSLEQHREAA